MNVLNLLLFAGSALIVTGLVLYIFFILKPMWNEQSLKAEEEKRLEAINRAFEQTQLQGGFHDYYEDANEGFYQQELISKN